MKFRFDKPTCQNIRKSLKKEWIETNGLGDYASSSLICCNTRKYHGLLVADLESPAGRHVLLSSLEESLLVGGRELCFSCRKHPGVFYPRGNEHLEEMDAGEWPVFRYRFGEVTLTRELMLIPGHRLLLVRYEVRGTAPDTPPVVLRVKPLLAFRNAHDLTRANPALRPETLSAPSGICLRPYEALPPLFMQVEGGFIFNAAPDWCFNVEYLVERERGFAYQEDLVSAGPVRDQACSRQTSVPHRFDGGAPDGARAQRHRRGLAAGSRTPHGVGGLLGESGRPSCPGRGALSCPEARWRPCRDGGLPLVRIVGAGYAYRAARPDLLCRKARRGHGRAARPRFRRQGRAHPQRLLRRRQPRLQLGGRLPLVCLGRAADAQGAAGLEGFDP